MAVGGEVQFILGSFSFLIWGGLVMWMCAGFTMREAGSVRTRNASVICLKNIGLPDYVRSSSCSIDRMDRAVGSVQRPPNRSEWAARRHVSGPNPVPAPVWSLEHEVRT